MEILITNDDGFAAKGILSLANIMCRFGNVTVVAPENHQSGMAMAVSLGKQRIMWRSLPEYGPGTWSSLDSTPASCVKYALNFDFQDKKPDVVVCGINHGSNAASAACYSGTLGAAEEAALNGVPAIAISLASMNPDADFSAVEALFPDIFTTLMSTWPDKYGLFYNINFPDLPKEKIKGVRACHQGLGKWVREFKEWEGEETTSEGEKAYIMSGDFVDDGENLPGADHRLLKDGYITVVPDMLDMTDYAECNRLKDNGFNQEFK